ncbi:MAG: CRISPR-associated protein Cas4 [Thermoplasmata archaeon]
MIALPSLAPVELLSPHDLVNYYRCPHEMELHRVQVDNLHHRGPATARTPPDVVPIHRSPLLSPPLSGIQVNDGRLDIFDGDRLIYADEMEKDMPVLFPPEHVALDSRFVGAQANLVDLELNLHGRPDFVIRRANGNLVPVEYKATHLFVGYHEAHGRLFDTIQAIAECRLVEAAFGRRPGSAIVLYGDQTGDGTREGWVEIPYTEADERWLRFALGQIRSDLVRAPVNNGRICATCEANERGLCHYAGTRFEGAHRHLVRLFDSAGSGTPFASPRLAGH